ncbi:MAG: hypothetical protein RLZ55_1654 [Actinomycetota bacterium]|jgi:hypothetical protein
MAENLGAAYAVAQPDIVADALDGEVILINLDSGMYFRARGDAALAWDAVVSGGLLTEVAGPAAQHLDAFVGRLLEHRLIVAVPPVAAGVAQLAVEGPFMLEAYSDLQNLLNLDPVHDVDSAAGWPATGA